jgi:hypothetical protein
LEDAVEGRGHPGQSRGICLRSIELPRAVHHDRAADDEHHQDGSHRQQRRPAN